MPWSLWKPLAQCALVFEKKSRTGDGLSSSPIEKKNLFSNSREKTLRDAIHQASEKGLLSEALHSLFDSLGAEDETTPMGRSRTLARLECQGLFLRATAQAAESTFNSEERIPTLDEAISRFLEMYPAYKSSQKIDHLRDNEYSHLHPKVCLDYCGFGLFSYQQSVHYWESSTFSLSEISANLSNHALYGGGEKGTVEYDIKMRIMDFLNIPESEYGLVFTVSRGSAFKLLGDAYPFHTNRRLLTMFDHESQSINWMAQNAREKGAKVNSAWFKWPTLQPCSTDLRKQITNRKKRKKGSAAGLFVFPVQSRVSGAKYSYQWMALAHQNNWHVLLDAGSLGPKDMDSLGLSLFRPDFIITSFYRVFGYDPSGFGCLLIKKSVMGSLHNRSGCTGPGMVKITPEFPLYMGDSVDGLDGLAAVGIHDDNDVTGQNNITPEARPEPVQQLPAFSGLYTSAQVKDVFDTEMMNNEGDVSDRDGASTCFEESGSISIGEMMKSPVFSDNGSSDFNYWIDLGQSPAAAGGNNDNNPPQLTPTWLNGRKSSKQPQFQRPCSRIHGSPVVFDNNNHEVNNFGSPSPSSIISSFDAAVLSANPNRLKHVQEEDDSDLDEIKEEDEEEEGPRLAKESAVIKRETEADFRLLRDTRGNNRYGGGRFLGVEENNDQLTNKGRRVSFSMEEDNTNNRRDQQQQTVPPTQVSETTQHAPRDDDDDEEEEEYFSDGEYGDEQEWDRKEPEISCRHLDHINELGLNKTSSRLRFLINWLVASLLQLRLPASAGGVSGGGSENLVCIYGPKIKYERGAAVAFNVRDGIKKSLVSPEIVQKLAEREGISLGIGFLSRIQALESSRQPQNVNQETDNLCKPMLENGGGGGGKSKFMRIEVVTASLGFLTNFEDVYRLWAFVAKFLDPGFACENELSTVAEEEDSET